MCTSPFLLRGLQRVRARGVDHRTGDERCTDGAEDGGSTNRMPTQGQHGLGAWGGAPDRGAVCPELQTEPALLQIAKSEMLAPATHQ